MKITRSELKQLISEAAIAKKPKSDKLRRVQQFVTSYVTDNQYNLGI